MRPTLLVDDDARLAVENALGDAAAPWNVLVLDWARRGARAELDAALGHARGVLVLARDEGQLLEAIELGATEAVVWPCAPAHLRARVERTARLAREPWLARMFELADDSIELTDVDATLQDVSPGFERVTGYARHDVLGKTTGSLFRVETADPTYYRQIGEGLAHAGVWRGQLTARRHDHTLSFMQATIATVRDGTGRTVGHLGIKRDASRDDLAASALSNAEARTRALLDRAAEAVVLHTLDGRIVEVNGASCRMLGLTRAEILERSLDAFEPSMAREAQRAWWSSLGETPASRETEWQRADGSLVPVEISAGRVDLVGNPFVFVVARDVTERRRAKQALETVNARLEVLNANLEGEVAARTREVREALAQQAAILDSVGDGLVAIAADHRVLRANPATARMFEVVSPEDGTVERLHPALGAIADECMQARVERTADIALAGGHIAAARAAPIVVENDDGTSAVSGCVILVRDVTREREVDRMKTDFIATVSHELRTPLTSVLGFAKLARTKLELLLPFVPEGDKKVARAAQQVAGNLEIISSEGARLGDLINDVLDISKLEAGRVDWREDVIHAGELVDRALTATSGLFHDSPVQRVRKVDDGLPAFVGDTQRLLQVVINLISNASKFTREGSITVQARRVPDGIEISVEDTGPGIPAKDHALIFERFRQSTSDTLTDKPKGTGLGLAISKHIVEHHGGRIWVESEVGRGSRFAFVLPAQAATKAEPAPSDEVLGTLVTRVSDLFPQENLRRGADVLVVDDDDSARELLVQVLTDAGHQVRTAKDGVAAMTEIRARTVTRRACSSGTTRASRWSCGRPPRGRSAPRRGCRSRRMSSSCATCCGAPVPRRSPRPTSTSAGGRRSCSRRHTRWASQRRSGACCPATRRRRRAPSTRSTARSRHTARARSFVTGRSTWNTRRGRRSRRPRSAPRSAS
jgi:PAS domain S-box-containing protein